MEPLQIAESITDIRFNNGLLFEEHKKGKMPTRKLGKTGVEVGLLSLGGQGSLERQGKEKNCVEIIERAYELGVNYFDTSPIYGPSEDYYGKALTGFRNKIFLASKTDDRTKDGSLRLIEKSLKRLKTDYLDLWQIHHLDKMEEVDQVTAKDGALQALLEMQEQKVIRFLGFTGHEDPKILLEMSKRHRFDTVLCPVNPADTHVKPSFQDVMIPEAKKQKLGIIGMKVFAQGHLLHPEGITTSWEVISFALSQPVSTIIVGCDCVAQLEENVILAKAFRQLTDSELTTIKDKAKKFTKEGAFFRSKFGGYKSQEKLGKPFTF